ncbi:putative ribosome quality control (RQC) complex YloA/Tae2 family protein [Aminivibrio pyruvatiphilus]|uniref:Putative ribosome quality control (RQC) complex YloA/Tae2 family protein n=1 Tax=Aminivibrio pyruvatiphilus TaxID=1005740 RepID=A0A4R8M6M5_9BACT|nr:NFACT family protein [Aminivibrio pyruvatiphilus]TDY60488.1 putative ribosome quality control (RQC) complex YloA/Tae2 family protein [Aminivibrio pyruvatiphilus]
MSFGPELFTAMMRSFEEMVLPCRIGKIETGDTWAAFRLSSGKDRWLLFSWNPGSYGCGIVGEDGISSLKKTRVSRSSFGEGLKRNFQNASILSVRQLNSDRVLVFGAERLVGAGFPVRLSLVFEGTERNSNLVILDETGSILEPAKHIHGDMNRYRMIIPGVAYTPPPPMKGKHLGETGGLEGPEDLRELRGIGKGLSGLLTRSWDGRPVGYWNDMLARLLSGKEQGLILQRHGPLLTVFPEPLPFCEVLAGPILERCGEEVLSSYFLGQRERILSGVKKALEKEIRSRKRHRDGLENQIRLSERGSEFLKMGNLLLAAAEQVPPRAREVELQDWETGEPVLVPLDENLSASRNAERYFRKYKKGKVDREAVKKAIGGIDEGITELLEQLEALESIDDPDLLSVSARDVMEWLAPKRTAGGRKQKSAPPPHIRLENGGDLIYIGLNARGNRHVTFKVAAPTDLWFHVHEIPGAHVILRTAGKDQVPADSSLEIAASLAAWFSRAKNSGKIQVDYTEKKNVRSIPGSAIAHVTYVHPRTILVSPDRWKEFPEAARSRQLEDRI